MIMMFIKTQIVRLLESGCNVIDRVTKSHRHILANWSATLDERWGCGHWTTWNS